MNLVQPHLPVAAAQPGHPWPVVRPSRRDVKSPLTRFAHRYSPILAKAFRGELTEQWRKDNPELIRGENSAEALLERIKAERAAMKSVKKAGKRKVKA